MRQYYWVKDLKKLRRRGYRKEQIIIVDDTPRKLERSYGNLVRVHPFEGDPSDDELLYLMRYLDRIREEENIRIIEKRGWRDNMKGLAGDSSNA
jgi:RNA polymerase II subunit A small phosphatase-like protein